MAHRGEMQEVDFEESLPPDSSRVVDAPDDAEKQPRRRGRRWVAVAVVALVGAVMLGGQWVVDERERDARARLAQVPGVLAPVDRDLDVARRVHRDELNRLMGAAGAFEQAADGSQSYSWFGPGGTVLWTAALLGPTPQLAEGTGATSVSACLPDVPDEPGSPSSAAQVVCLVTDTAWHGTDGGDELLVPGATRRIVVLDTADGAVAAEWEFDSATAFELLPGLVVLEDDTHDGAVLTAHDRVSGATRWTYAEPDSADKRETGGMSVGATGDNLLLMPNSRRFVVLDPRGQVVRDLVPDAGHRFDYWTVDKHLDRVTLSVDDYSALLLLSSDGDPSGDLSLRGSRVEATVDDGSAPGLVLTQGDALHAWDASTGDERWTADGPEPFGQAIILRGRVYVASGDHVTALDARTGKVLWDASAGGGLPVSEIFTDGTHILATTSAPDMSTLDPVLVGYDAVGGEVDFRATYPAGTVPGGSMGRELLAYDPGTGEYLALG